MIILKFLSLLSFKWSHSFYISNIVSSSNRMWMRLEFIQFSGATSDFSPAYRRGCLETSMQYPCNHIGQRTISEWQTSESLLWPFRPVLTRGDSLRKGTRDAPATSGWILSIHAAPYTRPRVLNLIRSSLRSLPTPLYGHTSLTHVLGKLKTKWFLAQYSISFGGLKKLFGKNVHVEWNYIKVEKEM